MCSPLYIYHNTGEAAPVCSVLTLAFHHLKNVFFSPTRDANHDMWPPFDINARHGLIIITCLICFNLLVAARRPQSSANARSRYIPILSLIAPNRACFHNFARVRQHPRARIYFSCSKSIFVVVVFFLHLFFFSIATNDQGRCAPSDATRLCVQ